MGRCPSNKAGGQKKKYLHKRARLAKFLKKDILYTDYRSAMFDLCMFIHNSKL